MTALVVETPSTATAWSVAHALGMRHAVVIAGPPDAHTRQAQAAETRPAKERQ